LIKVDHSVTSANDQLSLKFRHNGFIFPSLCIGSNHGTVLELRNKTSVHLFYRMNKIWVQVWVRMN